MAYKKIKWQDRILVTNDNGTINKIIQEGTPVSAFNLNHMDDGIFKIYNYMELMKKNQLELLTSRDLDNLRITMDEGYWFDTLKNENKIDNKTNINIFNNKLNLANGQKNGSIEFKTHPIDFKTDKTVYYHKRKSGYSELESATNKNLGENTVDVVAEIITINY